MSCLLEGLMPCFLYFYKLIISLCCCLDYVPPRLGGFKNGVLLCISSISRQLLHRSAWLSSFSLEIGIMRVVSKIQTTIFYSSQKASRRATNFSGISTISPLYFHLSKNPISLSSNWEKWRFIKWNMFFCMSFKREY
jgi:hypothetical protein